MKINQSYVVILSGINVIKDGSGFRKWKRENMLEIWSKTDLHNGDICKIQMLTKSAGPYLMAYEAKDMVPTHALAFREFKSETGALSATQILSQTKGSLLALAKLGKGYLRMGEKVFAFDTTGNLAEFGTTEDYEVALATGDIEPDEIAQRDPYSEVSMHYARTSGMGSYTRYSVIGPDGKDIPCYRQEGGAIGSAIWRWGEAMDAILICWSGSNSGIQRHSIRYCPPKPTAEQARWFRDQYEKHRADRGYVFCDVPEQLKRAMAELED
jgi:hypothetical protein